MYYDIGEEVKVKVLNVSFSKKALEKKIVSVEEDNKLNRLDSKLELEDISEIMEVNGSLDQEGLGPIAWWKNYT